MTAETEPAYRCRIEGCPSPLRISYDGEWLTHQAGNHSIRIRADAQRATDRHHGLVSPVVPLDLDAIVDRCDALLRDSPLVGYGVADSSYRSPLNLPETRALIAELRAARAALTSEAEAAMRGRRAATADIVAALRGRSVEMSGLVSKVSREYAYAAAADLAQRVGRG